MERFVRYWPSQNSALLACNSCSTVCVSSPFRLNAVAKREVRSVRLGFAGQ